jgi:hypothetical protein
VDWIRKHWRAFLIVSILSVIFLAWLRLTFPDYESYWPQFYLGLWFNLVVGAGRSLTGGREGAKLVAVITGLLIVCIALAGGFDAESSLGGFARGFNYGLVIVFTACVLHLALRHVLEKRLGVHRSSHGPQVNSG